MNIIAKPEGAGCADPWAHLKVSRKADREQMASEIEAIAAKHGAKTERRNVQGEIWVSIELGPLSTTVSLDPHSINDRANVFVFTWHSGRGYWLLDSAFQDVNPFHHAKANVVAYSFGELLARINRGLRLQSQGRATALAQ